MKTSDEGLMLIRQFEGFVGKPYLCPAGRWTIGYGHVMAASERARYSGIDMEAALSWLHKDIAVAERAVRQFIMVSLEQHQFDALVSFTFNLGSGVLQRSTLRAVINRGEEAEVPYQWMRWVWSGGRRLPGLARRRAAELALYLRK